MTGSPDPRRTTPPGRPDRGREAPSGQSGQSGYSGGLVRDLAGSPGSVDPWPPPGRSGGDDGSDLDRLRVAMAGLAEQGGQADLHRRVLDRSRRLGRRRAAGSAVAVAVAALLIGLPVALGRFRPVSGPPAAVAAPAPSGTPGPSITPATVRPRITALPSSTSLPAASSPASSSPASTSGGPEPRTTAPAVRPGTGGCPVGAATLQRASALPAGTRIAAPVECRENWAVAGGLFFAYDLAGHRWRFRGEGCGAVPDVPPGTGFCERG